MHNSCREQDPILAFLKQMAELQDKLDETSVLLKESKDENMALKDQAIQLSSSSSLSDSTQVEVRQYTTLIHQ